MRNGAKCVLAAALCVAAGAGAQSPGDERAARAAARAEARARLVMDPAAVAILEGRADNDPAKKQKEIAKETGYSPSQVSRILCSPDFQEAYNMLIYEAAAEARFKLRS